MKKIVKGVKKVFTKIFAWILLFITGKWIMADEIFENGLVDYSGQGKDRYGK